MITTIKITKETKKRILGLDLTTKDKSFDMIINELITSYEGHKSKYEKNYKKWKKDSEEHSKQMEEYKRNTKKYAEEKETWERLLKWAKLKGFKG